MRHRLGRKLGSVALSAGLAMAALSLMPAPAQAIPEADAIKKLQVVPQCLLSPATLKAFGLAFATPSNIERNFHSAVCSVPHLQHGATLLY